MKNSFIKIYTTFYFHTIKSILNSPDADFEKIIDDYFHTIKSILNREALLGKWVTLKYFHTIKSILNDFFKICIRRNISISILLSLF